MMFCSVADVEELSPVEKGRCGYITAEERGNVDSPENLGLRFHIKSIRTTPFKEINTPTLSGIQFKIQNNEILFAARSQRCPGSCSASRPLQAGLVLCLYV
jgi:hypothetical protein